MQKFHDGGEADGAAILAARIACGKEQERGTHALPSPAQQIRSDFRDGRKGGIALSRELFLDQNEVVADEIKNLFSREQRDGKSPDLTVVLETWGRESCRPIKTEEAPKIIGGGGGIVALAAPGLRRKVRSVRLNQNLLEG